LSVYGDVKEIIPTDIREPKGKYITLSHYFDVNLYHDMVTGRLVTAILHFLNQTLMDWYSKKQATVETATFGSEFIAARTIIDQIVDLRMTLRYLGIPIREKSYVFGDNKTVIDASLIPHAKLHMYTRDTSLYHSIMYEKQSHPSMLRSSICRANTTLLTFSASTGLMLWYGEP
jgi:hypothetical protein